jgi:hypothetical protein
MQFFTVTFAAFCSTAAVAVIWLLNRPPGMAR